MILGFASDHRGFKLKQELIKYFTDNGYTTVDYGTNSEESCDYPDFAYKLGNGVLLNEVDFGIAICGTGIGISIALNKMKGIYCAKVSNPEEAVHTRNDNNTNVIAFGEKMELNNAILSIEQFINTEYSYLEKHERRNKKVRQIENGEYNG
jgi:ribose 5-phosphate isomerase B